MPRKCWRSFSFSLVILFLRTIFQRRKPKILFWVLVFCAVTTCVIGKVSLAMITSVVWCLVDRVCVDPTFSTNLATTRFLIIGNFFATASRRELCVALRKYFFWCSLFCWRISCNATCAATCILRCTPNLLTRRVWRQWCN